MRGGERISNDASGLIVVVVEEKTNKYQTI